MIVNHRNYDKYFTVKRGTQQPKIKLVGAGDNGGGVKADQNALEKMKQQVQKLMLPYIGSSSDRKFIHMQSQTAALPDDQFRSIHTEHARAPTSDRDDAAVSAYVGPDAAATRKYMISSSSRSGKNSSLRSATESFRIANQVFVNAGKAPKQDLKMNSLINKKQMELAK